MSAAPDNDATGQHGSSKKYLRIFGALDIKLVSLVLELASIHATVPSVVIHTKYLFCLP